jgi:hypothetical protein
MSLLDLCTGLSPYTRTHSFYIFRSYELAGGEICRNWINELPNLCQPRTSVRGSGFQTRENAPSCNDRALALVSMLRSAAEIPLEKVLQFIKGGFSYRAKQEIHFAFEIWQANFVNHRIRDAEDYKYHHTYIWENPFKAGLNERPELFARSSASLGMELEVPPPGLKP